jgi:predicted double-glycine peptidase
MNRRAADYRAIPPGAIEIDLPNTTQLENYSCGAAALLAVCSYFGVGPEWEEDVNRDMKLKESGSDPGQIIAAAQKYGLKAKEYRGMTTAQLLACLRARRPVMMMLQAWSARPRRSYRDVWSEGHWVVAIGHDRQGIYFEDPTLAGARGFIAHGALDERWHDVEGADDHHVERLGIALWRPGVRRSAYARLARRID